MSPAIRLSGMRRRTLLRSLGAAGLGAALAGCLSGGSPGGDGDTTVPSDPTTSPTPTDRHTDTRPVDERTTGDGTTSPSREDGTSTPGQTDDSPWDPAAQKPFEIVEVGSRDAVSFPDNNRSHEIGVLNELDRNREIHVSIAVGAGTEELDLSRTFTFPAGGWVLFRLNVPSQYDIRFRASGTTLGSVTIGRKWFDCNGSRSRFGLTAEGVTDYEERTTLLACPDPEVAGTELTVTDRGCASKEASGATVSFGDEVVTVDGSIVTATPCRELSIEEATYDGDGDRLTVAVEASPSDGVCQQCVGALTYEATVAFEHDFPTTVVVEHHSRGRKTTVATATRGESA
ncbi:MAG: hypothetical protein ACI91T_000584 [Natronomonas sp.]